MIVPAGFKLIEREPIELDGELYVQLELRVAWWRCLQYRVKWAYHRACERQPPPSEQDVLTAEGREQA